MKTKSIFFILSIIIIVTSCWQDRWYNTYLFVNSSGHDFAVAIYNDPAPYTIVDTVFIKNGVSHLWKVQEGEGTFDWELYSCDSVRLIFDNERFLTYRNHRFISDSLFETVRNPINSNFHDMTCTRNNGCDSRYSITEDDYENAVPLVASH